MSDARVLNWYICELSNGERFHAYAESADEAVLDANYIMRASDVYTVNVFMQQEEVML